MDTLHSQVGHFPRGTELGYTWWDDNEAHPVFGYLQPLLDCSEYYEGQIEHARGLQGDLPVEDAMNIVDTSQPANVPELMHLNSDADKKGLQHTTNNVVFVAKTNQAPTVPEVLRIALHLL